MVLADNSNGHGNPHILVLGMGNTLLSDEGAGVLAIRQLASQLPAQDNLTLMDGGTLGFTLAAPIAAASHLIVIDAAWLDASPGTVRLFLNEDMDQFIGYGKRSAHEIGLTDLMHIAHLTGTLPSQRALIGIQPQDISLGEQPTPPVHAAIGQACEQARALIGAWQS